MSEDRIRELEQEVEDLIGLARGSEHALVVLASYLAHEIDEFDTKGYLSHLRMFVTCPRLCIHIQS